MGQPHDPLKTTGNLPKTYPYPMQCWRVGNLLWLSMGGEVVVDYSLQFKKQFGPHLGHQLRQRRDGLHPHLRVRQEGGYEGHTSMAVYGLPADRWKPNVEELVTRRQKLVKKPTANEQPVPHPATETHRLHRRRMCFLTFGRLWLPANGLPAAGKFLRWKFDDVQHALRPSRRSIGHNNTVFWDIRRADELASAISPMPAMCRRKPPMPN